MSKQVDERIVEMRFDNKHFETNVKTSMSTLDKLKQSLQFKDADKSFDGITKAAKKVDISHIGNSAEQVGLKFNAMYSMADQAMRRITDRAIDTGKKLVKSLSVDQITAGWTKYEQKTASVQTIMNATGKSIDEVNAYLDELMWFSDETSYGFTDMTAALAQMTSSGGDIKNLIPLITGVANATAYAGKGATEFSRVMYNLNQSYGAGYLQLMDWKSLELAGVGSKQLKQILIDTAVSMGRLKKGQVTIGTFSESLKDKWADTQVMEAAFGKFSEFSQAVHEMVASGEVETASEAMEKLADQYTGISVQAFKSAQQAKSFTEAIDATKDAVSSGWMRTYELIFGNISEATELWTDFCGVLWDLFASGGEKRNALLEEALGNPFTGLLEKIEKVTTTTTSAINKVKDYADVVNRILNGDFGNGQARWDKLTEAGYDWAHAQNLVNEKLGDSTRHATDFKEVQEEVTKEIKEFTDAELENLGLTKEEIEVFRELEKESKRTGKSINELAEEMSEMDGRTLLIGSFKNVGSSLVRIIESIRDAWSEVFPAPTAIQLYNLIKGLNEFTQKLRMGDETADKLKRTFKGLFAILDIVLTIVGGPLKLVLKAFFKMFTKYSGDILGFTAMIGDAAVGVRDFIDAALDFPTIFSKMGKGIMSIAEWVRNWANEIRSSDDIPKALLESFGRAFEYLGSKASAFGKRVLDKISGPINTVLGSIGKAVGIEDLDLSMVLSSIGNAVKGFASWLNSTLGITNAFKNLMPLLQKAANWIGAIYGKLEPYIEVAQNVVIGLINGLKDGIGPIGDLIYDIGVTILTKIKEVLGIHSPSTEFFEIGKNIVQGLINGIQNGLSGLWKVISNFGNGIIKGVTNLINSINFDVLFASVISAGVIYASKKIYDLMNVWAGVAKDFAGVAKAFAAPFEGLGKLFTSGSKLLDTINTNLKFNKWESASRAIMNMAIAIGILSASLWVISKIPWQNLLIGVGAIAALAGVLYLLTASISKLDVDGVEIGKLSLLFLSMSASLWIIATAIKKLKFINDENVGFIIIGLAAMIGSLSLIFVALGKFVKGKTAQNIDKAGVTILKMSLVMLGLVTVIKSVSKLEPAALLKGISCLALFGGLVVGLIASTKLAGKRLDAVGSMILKISAAMMLLTFVIKLTSKLDPSALSNGIVCMTLFTGVVAALMGVSRLAGGKDIANIGKTIIAMSAAMFVMTITIKMLDNMSSSSIVKGVTCIALFGGVVAGLVAITRLAGDKELKRVGTTILAMSLAIGALAAVAILLSIISIGGLIKGVTAVSILAAMMALMVYSLKGAQECQKTVIAMSITIGVMAAAILVLSFIDPTKLAGATIALATVMGMFALIVKTSGQVQSSVGSLIVMTLAIGLMGGMIYLLAQLPIESMLSAAISLSISMLALAGAFKIISNIKVGKDVLKSIGSLVIMCGLLVGFGWALSTIPDISGKEQSIITMALTMTAMTILLAAITAISKFVGNLGQMFSGILGLTVMCGLLVGFGWALSTIPDVSNKISTITILIATMSALSLLLLALTGIGAIFVASGGIGALCGLAGIGGLIVMLGTMYLFAVAIDNMPDISSSAATITMLTNIMVLMTALCVVLAIVGPLALIGVSAMSGLMGLMIAIGTLAVCVGALIDKFPALETFIDKGIPILEKLANGIGSIIGNFIDGFVTSALSGLPEIGLLLSQFMTNAMPFVVGIKMVDESVLKGIGVLAGAILALTAADLISGIASFLSGGSSFADLGTELSRFMINAMPFMTGVKLIDPAVLGGVKSLAEIILMLTGASILESLTSWLTGGTSFVDFGKQLAEFGPYIAIFAESVKDINPETIQAAANSGKLLAEMADAIPSDWGNNNLTNFGKQFEDFGEQIVAFSDSVTGKINIDGIKTAANASKKMADIAESIPSDWGNNNITNFGSQLEEFAAQLQSFSNKLEELNKTALEDGIEKIKSIMTLMESIDSGKVSAFTSFGEALKTVASEGISNFTNAFTDGMTKTTVEAAINDFIDTAIKTAKSKTNYDDFVSAGKYLVEGFAQGIDDNTFKAKAKAKAMAKAAYEAAKKELDINSPSKKFKMVGSSVVEGFVKGINDNVGDTKDAAKNLSSAMLEATQSELQINSPSLVFDKEVGRYIVKGIAEGITKDMSAEEAAEKKAQNIIDAFQKVFDKNDVETTIAKNALDIWLAGDEGKKATQAQIDAKHLEYLYEEFEQSNDTASKAWDKYQEMLKYFGKDDQKTQEALVDWQKKHLANLSIMEEIAEAEKSSVERQSTELSRALEIRDRLYEQKLKDKKLTDKEIDELNTERLKANIKDYEGLLAIANSKHAEAIEKYGADSEEVYQAWMNVRDIEDLIADAKNEISDIQEESLEREKDILKSQRTSANNIADLKYQIWEKTLGRDATTAEKNTAKLATLSQQMTIQTALLNTAKAEWDAAKLDSTLDASEIIAKEEAYYQQMLNVANLQNEIVDIQEKTIERQKNAKTEYDGYMKKYKEYYLKNGMTLEDLERDAKLISGYDPSNAVGSMINKANTAMTNLKGNSQYNTLITNFGNMGTSYAEAVNTGIDEQIPVVVDTTASMIEKCLDSIKSKQSEWTSAAASLMDNFINELIVKGHKAIEVAVAIAEAVQQALESDGSRPTISPVLDLTNVESEMAKLNNGTSTRLVTGISALMNKNGEGRGQNGSTSSTGGNVYQFTQNNYSPKSLSTSDIYRQTKAQFTGFKEATT